MISKQIAVIEATNCVSKKSTNLIIKVVNSKEFIFLEQKQKGSLVFFNCDQYKESFNTLFKYSFKPSDPIAENLFLTNKIPLVEISFLAKKIFGVDTIVLETIYSNEDLILAKELKTDCLVRILNKTQWRTL